jgi:CheY-like chemotaxis protein
MMQENKPIILMAEDDVDDRILNHDAILEAGISDQVYYVGDGVELLDYLCHRNAYEDPGQAPRPGLILLDLKMPRKNGWEALEDIQAKNELSSIPVFILTTSSYEEDLRRARELGVNGYYTKPVTFEALVEVMRQLGKYWQNTQNQ